MGDTTVVSFDLGKMGLHVEGDEDAADGLLSVENFTGNKTGMLERRTGSTSTGLTTPSGAIAPADTKAIWYRDEELCLEAGGKLYGRNSCVGGSSWVQQGEWSRFSMREQLVQGYTADGVSGLTFEGLDVCQMDDGCVLFAYRESGNQADMQVEVWRDGFHHDTFTFAGTDPTLPQIFRYDSTRAILFFEDSGSLEYRYIDPSTGTITTGSIALNASGYDAIVGVGFDGGPVWAAFYKLNATDRAITVGRFGLTNTTATAAVNAEVYLSCDLSPGFTGAEVHVGWAASTGSTIRAGVYALTPGGGSALFWVFGAGFAAGNAVQALAVVNIDRAAPVNNVEVYAQVLPAAAAPNVEAWAVANGPSSTLIQTKEDCRITSWGQYIDGAGAVWMELVDEAADEDLAIRSGEILWSPSRNHALARLGVGLTDGFSSSLFQTNTNPTPTGGFIRASWLKGSAADKFKAHLLFHELGARGANRPAIVDGVAISAHAGFPRGYDGRYTWEHDWHHQPIITDVRQGAPASTIPAGTYSLAVTWEWTDNAQGRLYRSAPSFITEEVASGVTQLEVDVNPLLFTERIGVRVVLWRTLAGGAQYFRCDVTSAEAAATLYCLEDDNTALTRERLDQTPTGVLFSAPANVTDFCAFAGGRVWSRNARRTDISESTIPRREGFGLHWAVENLLQWPADVALTSIHDMDGRVLAMGPFAIAATSGDGPSATGAGEYPPRRSVPVSDGPVDHNTSVRVPEGVAFLSNTGPQLLTRGLETIELGKVLDGRFRVANPPTGVAVVYDPIAEQSRWLFSDSDALGFSSRSQRWLADTARQCRDAATSPVGKLALLLTDGTVSELHVPVFTDGTLADPTAAYIARVRTPWFRGSTGAPDQPGLVIVSITVVGAFVDDHELDVLVYFDFDDTVAFSLRKDQATVVANNSASDRYIYRFEGANALHNAVSVEVRDNGEPRSTMRLRAIEIEFRPTRSPGAQLSADHLLDIAP